MPRQAIRMPWSVKTVQICLFLAAGAEATCVSAIPKRLVRVSGFAMSRIKGHAAGAEAVFVSAIPRAGGLNQSGGV